MNLHSGGNELEPPELQDREGLREDHCIGLFGGFSVAGVKLAMMNFGKGQALAFSILKAKSILSRQCTIN